MLEGDTDQMECSNTPSGPCLRVLSKSDEADGEPVLVDQHGGGLLLIRSWDETDSDTDPTTVPFLPHEWTDPPTDRLIYSDVEWWCLRWRSPDRSRGVTPWEGDCPAPADPCERIPPTGTRWNTDWSALTASWTTNTHCPQQVPALPAPAQAATADATGTLVAPHTIRERITDVELLICVASERGDRLQGAPHCAVDRMRFAVADPHGWMPPAPSLRLAAAVAADGLTVTEGTDGSFAVRLQVPPSANVDVTVSVIAPPEVTATAFPTSLTFTPTNWDTPQPVTVTVTDDNVREPESAFTITLTTASTGSDYSGLDPVEVRVTVPASDHPELLVVPATVMVAETATATLNVSLATGPQHRVYVDVASSDTAAVTVSPPRLTFAAANWDTAQPVTVTGVDDADISDETATVKLDPMSVDGDYNALADLLVAVAVTDDDTPALTLTADSVTVNENGTATVDVSLATQPSGPVTVTVASADPTAATAEPPSLTFTTTDWQTAQTVTITGTDDADYDNETTTVTLTADSNYGNLTASVAVTVTDDDSRFTTDDARSYVCARDRLTDLLDDSYFINGYSESWYPTDYGVQVTWVRDQSGCGIPDALPLGEADPQSLPNPRDKQALRDAIDALAVAAGLPQDLIDAAEGG